MVGYPYEAVGYIALFLLLSFALQVDYDGQGQPQRDGESTGTYEGG